jgi:transcriptional regulator with XRE-family HTH domain
MSMPKRSNVKDMLPAAVENTLRVLGQHLHIARKRRKESLKVFAERMQVSIPTLRKMEAGDPAVSVAAYATALWLIGRVHLLAEIANPATDETALMQELRTITSRGHNERR